MQLEYFYTPLTIFSLNLDYVRKGEGDLYTPYEEEQGDKTPPFPSGIVEKSLGGWLDFSHSFNKLDLKGRLGIRDIKNASNQPGDFNSYFFHLVAIYEF